MKGKKKDLVVREKFAQNLVKGMSQQNALLAANPRIKTPRQAIKRASALAKEPEVKERVHELLMESIPETVLKKNELLEILSDSIREAARELPTLVEAQGLVDKLAKLMGWYAPEAKDVAFSGSLTASYTPPKNVLAMTDEELARAIEET